GSYLLKAKQEDYKTYREKMVLDSLGPINKNLPLIKLTRKLFIGLKLGSTLADAQILANSNSILSPYATYYDNPKNIKIFTPNPKLFGYIGVSIEYFTSLKKRLAFQFEANYTALGAYYNNNPSLIINQLRFPLTIKYFVVKRYVAFTANASYNFNLNASYGNTNVLPLIQKQNYSFGGGLEINFVRSVYFGANYNIEQIPLLIEDKSNNKSYKNKTDLLILFIGVRL
ncbi:MAG: hypothetical protein QM539_04385, partial [Alphaproteobacteria bacterium]|nr:hypothetical protein [Alphaproteobacteria bacterium]